MVIKINPVYSTKTRLYKLIVIILMDFDILLIQNAQKKLFHKVANVLHNVLR